jgi:hypothetical protein
MPNETIKTLKIYKTLQDIVDKNNIMLTTDQVCDVARYYFSTWQQMNKTTDFTLDQMLEYAEEEIFISFLTNWSLQFYVLTKKN